MNIKLSEMLFEENNPNKLSKIFEQTEEETSEKKDDQADTQSSSEEQINLTKIELEKFAKIIAPKVDSVLPDQEKMMSTEAEALISTLKPLFQNRKIGGKFMIDVFDIFGDANKDLKKYSELGFILVEMTKDGDEISGTNAQGNNLREFFLLPFPGFQTSDSKVMEFHKELFNLDFKKIDKKDAEGKALKHLGVGSSIRILAVEEKTPGKDGKESPEIEKLKTALRGGIASTILAYEKKSETGTTRSIGEPKQVAAGVAEGKFYKEKLSNLLFEKKSLRQLKSSSKKEIVEYYLDVDYSSLNNYDKRDSLLLAELLVKLDNNLLTEATPQEIEKVAKSAAKAAESEDYYGNPIPADFSDKDKQSVFSKIKSVIFRYS